MLAKNIADPNNFAKDMEGKQYQSYLRRRIFRAKNRRRLILHAGLHKTGSTTLQTSLRKAGLLLPTNRSDFRSFRSMATKLTLAKGSGLVVSSEHLLGEMIGFYDGSLERIEWLRRNFDSIALIVYLRPQISWHESAFSQLVQQGTPITENEYLETVRQSRVADFRKLVHLISTLNESDSIGWIRSAPDVLHDFSNVLSYPLPRVENQNLSLHPLALGVMQRLRETNEFSQLELRQTLARWVPEHKAHCSVFSAETQSYFLSKRAEWLECAEILSTFQEIPHGWEQAYPERIKPSVRDVITKELLNSALDFLRSENVRRHTTARTQDGV